MIALISSSSLIWGGELEEGYKIGHNVECIRIGVLTTMRQFFAPLYIIPFPFLGLQLLCQASPFVAVFFSLTLYIDTIYVLYQIASSDGGGTCAKPCRRYSMY